jgi:hypothetical protein
MTPHPHDALIKTAFADPAHAAALLREIESYLLRVLTADSIAAVFED